MLGSAGIPAGFGVFSPPSDGQPHDQQEPEQISDQNVIRLRRLYFMGVISL